MLSESQAREAAIYGLPGLSSARAKARVFPAQESIFPLEGLNRLPLPGLRLGEGWGEFRTSRTAQEAAGENCGMSGWEGSAARSCGSGAGEGLGEPVRGWGSCGAALGSAREASFTETLPLSS